MDGLLREVQRGAWDGLIPTELSMDSSEVTSLQRPLPLYLLLPRMGYLPCVAEAISHHFGEVAPEVQRTLWLEETRSGEPLRWHIPTGVLFDLIAGSEGAGGAEEKRGRGWSTASEGGGATYDGGESISLRLGPERSDLLPWRITVHFQGCPRRQVFPLENEADIRRHYTNALKQALYLESGSSRAGMTLAKGNQDRLWQALKTNDEKMFHEMDLFLDGDRGGIRLVPVRLLAGGAPPSQLPIPSKRPDGTPFTLRDCLSWFCPDVRWGHREEGGVARTEEEVQRQKKHQPQQQQLEERRGGGGGVGVGEGETAPAASAVGGEQTPAAAAGGDGEEPSARESSTAAAVDLNVDGGAERKGGGGGGGMEGPGGVGGAGRTERLAEDRAARNRGPPVPAGVVGIGGGGGGGGGGFTARREATLPTVSVQGVGVPLDAPIIQLWGALRHPDHFLYVVVRKRG
ncbi:unnamed protein product [Pylaiella littoralis]